mmetsp:Transcript_14231/g.28715  ORF Transcript_14231/g.28715 Transcript_14231/m.28715 type:complete len:82 (-) Transcript_14231:7-252(-)
MIALRLCRTVWFAFDCDAHAACGGTDPLAAVPKYIADVYSPLCLDGTDREENRNFSGGGKQQQQQDAVLVRDNDMVVAVGW